MKKLYYNLHILFTYVTIQYEESYKLIDSTSNNIIPN